MLTNIIRFFTYFPYFIFAITMMTFVLRLKIGRRGKIIWAAVLLVCCSKFLCFQHFGASAFTPDLPVPLIWAWNWAYSGAVILCTLSILLFFRFPHRGKVLAFAAWGFSTWGVYNGIRLPIVREIELTYPDLPAALDGYRIAQLSDLHCSSAARRWRTQATVDIVNATKPDLIVLTGDYVDGTPDLLHDDLAPIADLKAPDGVWAVTGNHDHFRHHRGWWQWYARWGIRFLANECVFPRKELALGGVNDFLVARPRGYQPLGAACPDIEETFAAATNGEFRVLLQHQPRQAHANIEAHGVRLQLSGHTHGGIMPGFDIIVARHNSGFTRGLYEYPHGRCYVNPGSGQWAGFPIRFFNPSEITVITLRRGLSSSILAGSRRSMP